MSNEVANLISKRFLSRADVKAIQKSNGEYRPHTASSNPDSKRIPWSRDDLNAHLAGEKTFGHYLINPNDECKLFAFDIDLEKSGSLPTEPFAGILPTNGDPWSTSEEVDNFYRSFTQCDDLRAAWRDRSHPARDWMKMQFKEIAIRLVRYIHEELDIPTIAAYSGSKGVHVYALTGLISAHQAREGAQIVLDGLSDFKLVRGNNFYKSIHPEYDNLSIEIYPKQESLSGKDLGNLMRLPLGRNRKNPKDPTFFLDMTAPLSSFVPLDPVYALTEGCNHPLEASGA